MIVEPDGFEGFGNDWVMHVARHVLPCACLGPTELLLSHSATELQVPCPCQSFLKRDWGCPDIHRIGLGESLRRDLFPWMRVGDSCRSAKDLHGVANQPE
jgi:hypothetical protein